MDLKDSFAKFLSMNADYTQALTSFGTALREARLDSGQSQEALALKVGLDRTYVSATERGRKNPTLVSMLRLCEGLDITISELLAGVR